MPRRICFRWQQELSYSFATRINQFCYLFNRSHGLFPLGGIRSSGTYRAAQRPEWVGSMAPRPAQLNTDPGEAPYICQ
jgi:hypothetical protein